MKRQKSLVSVIDDDESVRESLPYLLNELGYAAQAFESAEQFLASKFLQSSECLILDVRMPGMSGPDLQLELKRRGIKTPIIFITATPDTTTRERLLKQGAVECLIKPFSDTMLSAALKVALKLQ